MADPTKYLRDALDIKQADEDGVMVLVSRQALEETLTDLAQAKADYQFIYEAKERAVFNSQKQGARAEAAEAALKEQERVILQRAADAYMKEVDHALTVAEVYSWLLSRAKALTPPQTEKPKCPDCRPDKSCGFDAQGYELCAEKPQAAKGAE